MSITSEVRQAAKSGRVAAYVGSAQAAVSQGHLRAVVEHDIRNITIKYFEEGPDAASTFARLHTLAYQQPARLYKPFCDGVTEGIRDSFFKNLDRLDRSTRWADLFRQSASLINGDIRLSNAVRDGLEESLPRLMVKRDSNLVVINGVATVVAALGSVDCAVPLIGSDLIGSLVVRNFEAYPEDQILAAQPVTTLRQSNTAFAQMVGESETERGIHVAYIEGVINTSDGWRDHVALAAEYNQNSGAVRVCRLQDKGLDWKLGRNRFTIESVVPSGASPYVNMMYDLLNQDRPSSLAWVTPLANKVEERLFSSAPRLP